MKLSNQQLKQIIREELQNVLSEADWGAEVTPPGGFNTFGLKFIENGRALSVEVNYNRKPQFTHNLGNCDEFKGCQASIDSYSNAKPEQVMRQITQWADKSSEEDEVKMLVRLAYKALRQPKNAQKFFAQYEELKMPTSKKPDGPRTFYDGN
tara:strand:+ start:968 stop:1423 length:456 start_codon:yes stop_codon:yes gene_type:complete